MIALDLETAPQARALALPYPKAERTPPANYKNEDAIARWYEKDEADWKAGLAKTAALNPRLGRVVAVGINTGDNYDTLVECDEAKERELLGGAFHYLTLKGPRLLTFNGLSFDLPFLHVRAAILGVPIPYKVGDYLRRYVTNPHADLCAVLQNWGRSEQGDTLHGWCEAFGILVTDTTTGAEVGAAVERGDTAFIHTHCAIDVALTWALGEKLIAAGLIAG